MPDIDDQDTIGTSMGWKVAEWGRILHARGRIARGGRDRDSRGTKMVSDGSHRNARFHVKRILCNYACLQRLILLLFIVCAWLHVC
jgi:hypothetical protein